MTYEELSIQYDDLVIKEADFSAIDPEGDIDGLCVKNKIFIRKDLKTAIEKTCILAEEIGHYQTTVGNILDQSKSENRKQEQKARRWAIKKLVRIEQLIDAYNAGIKNKFELAEFLDVTENFVDMALEHYKSIYGVSHQVGNFLIYFDPLIIFKRFDYEEDKPVED